MSDRVILAEVVPATTVVPWAGELTYLGDEFRFLGHQHAHVARERRWLRRPDRVPLLGLPGHRCSRQHAASERQDHSVLNGPGRGRRRAPHRAGLRRRRHGSLRRRHGPWRHGPSYGRGRGETPDRPHETRPFPRIRPHLGVVPGTRVVPDIGARGSGPRRPHVVGPVLGPVLVIVVGVVVGIAVGGVISGVVARVTVFAAVAGGRERLRTSPSSRPRSAPCARHGDGWTPPTTAGRRSGTPRA